jgi:hypothetical protein
MSQKPGFLSIAAVGALLASGAQFAAAQSGEKRDPAANRPMSRPANSGAVNAPRGLAAMPLTPAECEGMGGKVVLVEASVCPGTIRQCVTADNQGVIHRSCITETH